jgi:hypothetical protein
MFTVGDVVICIDGDFPQEVWQVCEQVPEEGELYVVRDVVSMGHYLTRVAGVGLRLRGVCNPVVAPHFTQEASFGARRFRLATVAEVEAYVAGLRAELAKLTKGAFDWPEEEERMLAALAPVDPPTAEAPLFD